MKLTPLRGRWWGVGHLEGETKQNVKIKHREGGRERQTDRQAKTDRQTEGEREKQRETDRQTDRQREQGERKGGGMNVSGAESLWG